MHELNALTPENEKLAAITADLHQLEPMLKQLGEIVATRQELTAIATQSAVQLSSMRDTLNSSTSPLLLPIKLQMFDTIDAWLSAVDEASASGKAGTDPTTDTSSLETGTRKILDTQASVLNFKSGGHFILGMIAESVQTRDLEHLNKLESDFLQHLSSMATPLVAIEAEKPAPKLNDLFKQLLEMGVKGDDKTNIYKVRRAELETVSQANNILNESRALATALALKVEEFVGDVDADTQTAAMETAELASNTSITLIIITAVALVIAVVIGWLYVARNIVGRIVMLLESMQKLSEGDLTASIYREGNDELSRMGSALAILRNVYRQAEELKATQEREKLKNEEDKRKAALSMADDFDASVGQSITVLSSNVGQMRDQAGEMQKLSESSQAEAKEISEASGVMSNDISSVASAVEELSASVSAISHQVSRNSEVSQEAVKRAEEMNGNIGRLEEGSRKIEDVTGLINSIAEQTNLLALNATIEAARAGEAGKGFAVVASEVKNLANQTTNATEEISGLISTIQTEIKQAANIAGGFNKVIGEIDTISSEISVAVEEQGSATHEINMTVTQSAEHCAVIASRVEDITQALNNAGNVMEDVIGGVKQVDEESRALNQNVEGFLGSIRQG